MKRSAEVRFWAKVDTSGGLFACWPWQGARSGGRYGSFEHTGAHRFALELALGRPLAPGMQACHTCDNPPCVNPAHLFEGTGADNIGDRHAKGRDAVGSRNGAITRPESRARGDRNAARKYPGFRQGIRNGRHRLTENDVRIIRIRLLDGVRWLDIAAEFGIAKSTVSHIAARRTWQHVA